MSRGEAHADPDRLDRRNSDTFGRRSDLRVVIDLCQPQRNPSHQIDLILKSRKHPIQNQGPALATVQLDPDLSLMTLLCLKAEVSCSRLKPPPAREGAGKPAAVDEGCRPENRAQATSVQTSSHSPDGA